MRKSPAPGCTVKAGQSRLSTQTDFQGRGARGPESREVLADPQRTPLWEQGSQPLQESNREPRNPQV